MHERNRALAGDERWRPQDAAWRPREQWIDAAATWKDAGTLAIEYTPAGAQKASVMNVRIPTRDWVRFPPR